MCLFAKFFEIYLFDLLIKYRIQIIIREVFLYLKIIKRLHNILHSYMIKIFLLIFFVWLCSSRLFQTSMKFSNLGINRGWLYLDKMSFAPGTVSFTAMTIVSGIPYGGDGLVTI